MKNTLIRATLGAIALAAVSGCANLESEPFTVPEPGSIPEGPGLFTGEEGAFVIYESGSSSTKSADKASTGDADIDAIKKELEETKRLLAEEKNTKDVE